MMARWIATALIAALLVLDLLLPGTSLGRRGTEALARADITDAVGEVGQPLVDFALVDLDGQRFRLADLRGRRVLLTFERSLDW